MLYYSTVSEEVSWWIRRMVLGMEVVAEMKYLCIHEDTITTTSINITEVHQSNQWEERNRYMKGM
jgi:hypothetical protein